MGLGAFALGVTHVWDVLGFCVSVICKCVLLRGDARMWFGFEGYRGSRSLSFDMQNCRSGCEHSGLRAFELRLMV